MLGSVLNNGSGSHAWPRRSRFETKNSSFKPSGAQPTVSNSWKGEI